MDSISRHLDILLTAFTVMVFRYSPKICMMGILRAEFMSNCLTGLHSSGRGGPRLFDSNMLNTSLTMSRQNIKGSVDLSSMSLRSILYHGTPDGRQKILSFITCAFYLHSFKNPFVRGKAHTNSFIWPSLQQIWI